MAISDITLGAGLRNNLTSLQLTTALLDRTQNRLATGLEVNNAIDDPTAFFAAEQRRSRASDLSARKDAANEAIQTVTAANKGVEGITALIEQARGLTSAARSATVADRATLATQFDSLLVQIDELSADAGYGGTNLLVAGSSLTVTFNENGSSTLVITGFDGTSLGLGINPAVGAFATDLDIDAAVAELDTALSTLRTNAAGLAADAGVITTRLDFTQGIIDTLEVGADNLTAADLNKESANLLALQTRQQLGIVGLSLTTQAQQGILRLF